MLPENRAFLIRGEDGAEYGPVDLGELREWVVENRAGVGTLVRRDEPNASWNPWQTYPELIALLAEIQGTRPSGPPGMVIALIWRRVMAWIMDIILISILFIPIMSVLQLFMPMDVISQAMINPVAVQEMSGHTLHQVAAFEIFANSCVILYLAGFWALHGKTPAMAILGLRVVDQQGKKPSLLRSFLRAVALIFSINLLFIPMAYAFIDPQRRTFHDFIAGTYVVNT